MEIQTIPLAISGSKPGRTLTQFDLQELAELVGEPLLFPYVVRMLPGSGPAGNHYHLRKCEVFVCLEGEMRITFADPETSNRGEIILRADAATASPDPRAVIVPIAIAHAVENIGTGIGMLLVLASHKARDPDDDFHFSVVPFPST